jgi:isopentenyl-diphosphate delta-isomerase
MQPEYIVLTDEQGRPIGQAEKLASHHAQTPRHLAFSCYIFDDKGRLLVTQRAAVKKVWPTVWTNSVCGHPAPAEATEAAIRRRTDYELGMTIKDIQCVLPDYRYTTPPYNGIIENEICPVFAARAASDVTPNPLEVDDYRWMAWPDFAAAAQADTAEVYSWWCKDQLRLLNDNPLLRQYAATTA